VFAAVAGLLGALLLRSAMPGQMHDNEEAAGPGSAANGAATS